MATPTRLRRVLRALGVVCAGIALAVVALLLTRNFWIERVVERYAGRALGKTIDLRGVHLGRSLDIDELLVSTPAHAETPLLHLTKFHAELEFHGLHRPGLRIVRAAEVQVNWQPEPPAAEAATPRQDFRPMGLFRGRGRGSAFPREGGLLPATLQIEALTLDAKLPDGTYHLGPIAVDATTRPNSEITLRGEPKIHAEGPRLPQAIDTTGKINIHAARDAKGIASEIDVSLPRIAKLDAKFSGGRDKRGFSAGGTVAEGHLNGAFWSPVITAALGVPVDFAGLEVAPNGVLQVSMEGGAPSFKGLDLKLSSPVIQVGPKERPWYCATTNVALTADPKGGAWPVARITLGPKLVVNATVAGLLPPVVELTLDKASAGNIHVCFPALPSLAALDTIAGKAKLTPVLPRQGINVDAQLDAQALGVAQPIKLEAQYTATTGKATASAVLSENTRLDIAPFDLGGERFPYTAKADLADLAPFTGLKDWAGTAELKGELARADYAGKFEAKILNLITPYFHTPYDVPLTLLAETGEDAGDFTLLNAKAALTGQLTATAKDLHLAKEPYFNQLHIVAQAAFFAGQGFLDGGDGTFTYHFDKLMLRDGILSDSGAFTLEAKSLIFPNKTAAATNVSAKGFLGWFNGLQVQGEARADEILCAGAVFANPTANLRADGPAVVLDDLRGTLFNGAVAGSLRVEPGPACKLDARIEGGDLAVFTAQVKPPSVNVTGLVSGNVLVGLQGEDFSALDVDLEAPKGITVNRDLIQEALMSQQMNGFTGAKTVEKVLQKIIGGDEQRPFDSAALKLGLADDRISGTASLKSKALNLDFDIKADPGAVWEAIQSRGEVHFGGLDTK